MRLIIVVEEKPAVVSQFLEVFPTNRIPKVTNDINVNFFIRTFTEVPLIQQLLQIIPPNSSKSDVWLTVHRNSMWIRKTN